MTDETQPDGGLVDEYVERDFKPSARAADLPDANADVAESLTILQLCGEVDQNPDRWFRPDEKTVIVHSVGGVDSIYIKKVFENQELPDGTNLNVFQAMLSNVPPKYSQAITHFLDHPEEWDVQTAAEVDPWMKVRSMYDSREFSNKEARHKAVQLLQSRFTFATMRDTEEMFRYNPATGVYEPDGESFIKEHLVEGLRSHYSTTEEREVLANLRGRTFHDRDTFGASPTAAKICLANGVLDLVTREVEPHDPSHKFLTALPVTYDADADASHFDAFLDGIIGRPEDKRVLSEMLGYCLWPTNDYRAFLILYGEGSNGKSTFFEVVERFLGEENSSNCTLKQLTTNRFAKADLYGRMANIAPDLSASKIKNTGDLKDLTGGDTVHADVKNRAAFSFRNRAKLMFGANQPPIFDDATHALRDRILPIHLPNQFTSENDGNPDAQDRRELMAEMTTDEELSGILNAALDGLDRLRDTGQFSIPESPEARMARYQQEADPIRQFADACLTNEQGRELRKSTVYDAYTRFVGEHGYTPRSESVFHRELRKHPELELSGRRAPYQGDRPTVYANLSFADDGWSYTAATRTFDELLDNPGTREQPI